LENRKVEQILLVGGEVILVGRGRRWGKKVGGYV
jgi:hypothetical protein